MPLNGGGQVAGSLADSPGSRGVQPDLPPHRVDVGGRSGQRDIAGDTDAERMPGHDANNANERAAGPPTPAKKRYRTQRAGSRRKS